MLLDYILILNFESYLVSLKNKLRFLCLQKERVKTVVVNILPLTVGRELLT